MSVAIVIVGAAGCVALLILGVCLALIAVGNVYESATARVIEAARAQERERITHHYTATSWWFSECPDAQHALALVAEEIATGRCDSSRLRDDWKRKTGRSQ